MSPATELQARFRGEVVDSAHPAYDSARKVYNGMIDKRPQAIVRCADTADVMSAVNYARESHLRTAIRGGGHNGGGLGTCDGGLVIDLCRMKGVHVNPDAATIRVDGGCTWGDVDHAGHAFGLTVPSGVISTTGVGGLTLGGGLGHLTRKYGLTIDHLLSVDIVLADGSFVTADGTHHQDLYWAVRGGGGNFGVVTSFLFHARPVHTVFAGMTLWPVEQAAQVMQRYRSFITNAPEDISGFFAFMAVPPAPMFPQHLHGKKVCGIVWCCTGPADKAEKAMQPLRRSGKPALDHVGPIPFPALQSIFDPFYPPGLQWYWKADFVKELSDEAIALHVRHGSGLPTPLSAMHLYPIDGAAHKHRSDDTAFSFRDANWAEVIFGVDVDPANKDEIVGWARRYFDDVHPYSAGGAYVNFMMDEGQDRVKATYRDNYGRLSAIKKKYDPENFFSVNQNIRPER